MIITRTCPFFSLGPLRGAVACERVRRRGGVVDPEVHIIISLNGGLFIVIDIQSTRLAGFDPQLPLEAGDNRSGPAPIPLS